MTAAVKDAGKLVELLADGHPRLAAQVNVVRQLHIELCDAGGVVDLVRQPRQLRAAADLVGGVLRAASAGLLLPRAVPCGGGRQRDGDRLILCHVQRAAGLGVALGLDSIGVCALRQQIAAVALRRNGTAIAVPRHRNSCLGFGRRDVEADCPLLHRRQRHGHRLLRAVDGHLSRRSLIAKGGYGVLIGAIRQLDGVFAVRIRLTADAVDRDGSPRRTGAECHLIGGYLPRKDGIAVVDACRGGHKGFAQRGRQRLQLIGGFGCGVAVGTQRIQIVAAAEAAMFLFTHHSRAVAALNGSGGVAVGKLCAGVIHVAHDAAGLTDLRRHRAAVIAVRSSNPVIGIAHDTADAVAARNVAKVGAGPDSAAAAADTADNARRVKVAGDGGPIGAVLDGTCAAQLTDNAADAIRTAADAGDLHAAAHRQIANGAAGAQHAKQAIMITGRTGNIQVFDLAAVSVKGTLIGIGSALSDGCPFLALQIDVRRQLRADGAFAVVIHLCGKPAQLAGIGNEVGIVLRTAACGFQGHRDLDRLHAASLHAAQIDHAGLGNIFRAVERPLVLIVHGQQIAAVRLGGHGDFIPYGLGIRDLDGRRGVLGIVEAHRGGRGAGHRDWLHRIRPIDRHRSLSICIAEFCDGIAICAVGHGVAAVALRLQCVCAALDNQLRIGRQTGKGQLMPVQRQREGLRHVRGLHRDGAGLGGIVPRLVADRVGMLALCLILQRIHTICAAGLLHVVPDELGIRRHHRDNHGGCGVGIVVLPCQNGIAAVDVRCIFLIRLAQLAGQRLQLVGGFAGDGRVLLIAAFAVCRVVVVAFCEAITRSCGAIRKAKAFVCGSRYLSRRIAVCIGVFIAVAAIDIARKAAGTATGRRYVTGGIAIRHRQRIVIAGLAQQAARSRRGIIILIFDRRLTIAFLDRTLAVKVTYQAAHISTIIAIAAAVSDRAGDAAPLDCRRAVYLTNQTSNASIASAGKRHTDIMQDNVLEHCTAIRFCKETRISAGSADGQIGNGMSSSIKCTVSKLLDRLHRHILHVDVLCQPIGLSRKRPAAQGRQLLCRVDQVRIVLRTAARQRHRRRHNGGQHRLSRKRGIILLLALVVPLLPDVLHFGVRRNGICVLRPHRCGNQAGQHDQRQQQRYHSFLHVTFSFSMFNFLCVL